MKIKLIILIFIFGYLASFTRAQAADLSLSISKTNILPNQTFIATVYTNTKGENINNAEGTIIFPKDLLSIDSVSNNGSIFTIWVEQPSFSNTSGTVTFNGGVPNPGYRGTAGKILSITFRAKKAGRAELLFSSGNVYLNDGLGTDVTYGKYGAVVNVETKVDVPIEPTPATATEPVVLDNLPPGPNITSKELPDPERWYSVNRATFSWNVPNGVLTTQTLYGSVANATPNISYTPPITFKTLDNLTDGVHYLHVRFKNKVGWGNITHRKIKIDITPPTDLNIASSVNNQGQVDLKITSADATSGINKYKVSLDGVFYREISAEKGETDLTLPAQKSGQHELSVIAYDQAGNVREKVLQIDFPKVSAPEIIDYPKSIKNGESLEIAGMSYPNTNVRIWLQRERGDAKDYVVKSLPDGKFSLTTDSITASGTVTFWAEAVITADITSAPSDKYFIVVKKSDFVKYSLSILEILSVLVPILILIILLVFVALRSYFKLKKTRGELMTDFKDTEDEVHKMFELLKDDVKLSLNIFKKKEIKGKLTEDDIETIDTLKKDVEEAEKYFDKRMKLIERKDL